MAGFPSFLKGNQKQLINDPLSARIKLRKMTDGYLSGKGIIIIIRIKIVIIIRIMIMKITRVMIMIIIRIMIMIILNIMIMICWQARVLLEKAEGRSRYYVGAAGTKKFLFQILFTIIYIISIIIVFIFVTFFLYFVTSG